MRTYRNGMVSTEVTAKQVNVIYSAAKRGLLKVQKFQIKAMYDLANYYGHDYCGDTEIEEKFLLDIINFVFKNDYENAQDLINTRYDQNKFGGKFVQMCGTELL